MDAQELQQPQNHQVVINRFVTACQADERVVAAFLGGSYARDAADAYSDLDLYLITTVTHIHGGPYRVLLDKKGILAEAVFPWPEVTQAEQIETLRRLVSWFWHDLSHHFITALARGQIWSAYGALEDLRLTCVNLARLRQNFQAAADGYEKVEQAIPVEQLAPLQATFCPMEQGAMIQAALVIVQFYRELAPSLAQAHGITYPADLEQVMYDRLEQLCNSDLN